MVNVSSRLLSLNERFTIMSSILGFSVFAIVSSKSPSVDSFVVIEDGVVNHLASQDKFLAHLDSLKDAAKNRVTLEEFVVKNVNAVCCSKPKDENVPVGQISTFLASKLVEGSENSMSELPVVSDWIEGFIKRHSECTAKDWVTEGEIHWLLQLKGRGAGIQIHKSKEPGAKPAVSA